MQEIEKNKNKIKHGLVSLTRRWRVSSIIFFQPVDNPPPGQVCLHTTTQSTEKEGVQLGAYVHSTSVWSIPHTQLWRTWQEGRGFFSFAAQETSFLWLLYKGIHRTEKFCGKSSCKTENIQKVLVRLKKKTNTAFSTLRTGLQNCP